MSDERQQKTKPPPFEAYLTALRAILTKDTLDFLDSPLPDNWRQTEGAKRVEELNAAIHKVMMDYVESRESPAPATPSPPPAASPT